MNLLGAIVSGQRCRLEHIPQRTLGVPAAQQLAHLGCDVGGAAGGRWLGEGAWEEGLHGEVDGGVRVEDIDVDGAIVIHFGGLLLLLLLVQEVGGQVLFGDGWIGEVIEAIEQSKTSYKLEY